MENFSRCPICGHEDCDELIIDLKICNSCSHIFKEDIKDIKEEDNSDVYKLESCLLPVEKMQELYDKLDAEEPVHFKFPSMVLYDLELYPTEFYRSDKVHYFNQMSISLLLKRSGFRILRQLNYWEGKACITEITIIKDEVKE